jgi:hypothetical protein
MSARQKEITLNLRKRERQVSALLCFDSTFPNPAPSPSNPQVLMASRPVWLSRASSAWLGLPPVLRHRQNGSLKPAQVLEVQAVFRPLPIALLFLELLRPFPFPALLVPVRK